MASSVRLARHLLTLMGTQKLPDSDEPRLEETMIEMEVRALLEKCLDAGDGDMAVGMCKGVEAGWIDTMLTPWKYNKGKVMVMRDAQNAVRYLDPGDIPLPKRSSTITGRSWRAGRRRRAASSTSTWWSRTCSSLRYCPSRAGRGGEP